MTMKIDFLTVSRNGVPINLTWKEKVKYYPLVLGATTFGIVAMMCSLLVAGLALLLVSLVLLIPFIPIFLLVYLIK